MTGSYEHMQWLVADANDKYFSISPKWWTIKNMPNVTLTIRYICVDTDEDYFKYLGEHKVNMSITTWRHSRKAGFDEPTVVMNCDKYFYAIESATFSTVELNL